MRIPGKLLLAALTSALLLTAIASSASASRAFEARPAGAITGTAPVTFASGEQRVTSLVTLTGELERTIAKTVGALVGRITGCVSTLGETGTGVRVRIKCDLSLPWHVRYVSFAGTLPNITSITVLVLDVSFLLRDLLGGIAINCLYLGDVPALVVVGAGGGVERIRIIEESVRAVEHEGRPACTENPEGTLTGTFVITPRQTVALL